MAGEFEVTGTNDDALFTLKIHRGEGMALLAMNWKDSKPAEDFVGFAIEYKEPAGAYDLNVPQIVERLEKLGDRVKVIVDDSGTDAALFGASATQAGR